jgi:hypothetical protein
MWRCSARPTVDHGVVGRRGPGRGHGAAHHGGGRVTPGQLAEAGTVEMYVVVVRSSGNSDDVHLDRDGVC